MSTGPRRVGDASVEGRGPTVAELIEDDDIRWAVGAAEGHWNLLGLSRDQRRLEGERLAAHLTAEMAAGRSVRDVVGRDVIAFASRWAREGARRPWATPFLDTAELVLPMLGVLALLGPRLSGLPSTGVSTRVLWSALPLLVVWGGIYLIQWNRARLSVPLAWVAGVTVAALALVTVVLGAAADDRVIAVPTGVAWATVGAGVLAGWVGRRLRRR